MTQGTLGTLGTLGTQGKHKTGYSQVTHGTIKAGYAPTFLNKRTLRVHKWYQ